MKRGCPKTSIAASSTKRKKTSKNESKGSKSGLVRQHPEESTSPDPKRLNYEVVSYGRNDQNDDLSEMSSTQSETLVFSL